MNETVMRPLRPTWTHVGLVLLALLVSVSLVISIVWPEAVFISVGLASLLIVLVPLADRNYDYFSPWSFVIVAVFLGTTLRSLCIAFDWPDPELINDRLLLQQGIEFFRWPSVVLMLGLGCLTAGYMVWRPKDRWTLVNSGEPDSTRLLVTVVALVLVSLVATVLFFQWTGGFSAGIFSGKRRSAEGIAQFGTLRKLSGLSTFAYLLLLTHVLFSGKALTLVKKVVIGVLFALSSAIPAYSSSRLPIAWLFLSTAAVYFYSKRDSRRILKFVRRLVVPGLGVVVLLHAMSVMRLQRNVVQLAKNRPFLDEVAVSFLVNRHYAGLAKTAHIVNAVPEELELEYGKSVIVWLVAPIPRALWPGKPTIHSGIEVGQRVFGVRTSSGVPPGLIAELYWNFHLVGVVLGCVLFGILLRGLYEHLRPVPRANSYLVPIYVVGPMKLGFNALSVSLGYALAQAFMDVAIMAVIVYFVYQPLFAAAGKLETVPVIGSPSE